MHQPNKKSITELDQTKLNVLLKDYEFTSSMIEKFVGNQFIYIQGALALSAGYIFFLVEGIELIDKAVSTKVDTKLYLQFLPFFILMILTAILYQYQRTIGLQGYKHYLERIINKLLGQNLISYGRIGMKYMLKQNIIALLNACLYALIYVFVCLLAYNKPTGAKEPEWYISHILVFIIFLGIAIWQTSGSAKKVTDIAQNIFESEKEIKFK